MAKKKAKTRRKQTAKPKQEPASDAFDKSRLPDPDRPLSTSERKNEQRAAAALEKQREGKDLSQRDQAAIDQWERISAERLRWKLLNDFTRQDFGHIVQIDSSGLARLAKRMGISSLLGRSASHPIDFPRVIFQTFKFIKDNHRALAHAERYGDESNNGQDIKHERALLQLQRDRMAFEREAGELVSRKDIDDHLEEVTAALKDCIARLESRFGDEARDIMLECIERLHRAETGNGKT